MGYKLIAQAPVNLTHIADVIEAILRAGARPALINCPLSLCRSVSGFTYDQTNPHPMMRTARAIAVGTAQNYRESPLWELQSYLRTVPNLEAWRSTTHVPWATNLGHSATRRSVERLKENRTRGKALDSSHGWTGFGYMSDEKGELEFSAIAKLVASMNTNGYLRNDGPDGDILITPMIRGDDVRFVARGGKHRIAVAAGLGHEIIPARMNPVRVVRCAEAAHWPLVRSGHFSLDEAIQIFQDIFEGRTEAYRLPPSWTSQADRPTSGIY